MNYEKINFIKTLYIYKELWYYIYRDKKYGFRKDLIQMKKAERKIIAKKLERAYASCVNFKRMNARGESIGELNVTQTIVNAAKHEYDGMKSIACALGFDMDEIHAMEDRIREENGIIKWDYYMRGNLK